MLDTGEDNLVADTLEDAYRDDIEIDAIGKSIVTHIHQELTGDRCDRNWDASYPYVIFPTLFVETSQQFGIFLTTALVFGLSVAWALSWMFLELLWESHLGRIAF